MLQFAFLEKGGQLVETDYTHLFTDDVTPFGSLTTGHIPEGAMVSTMNQVCMHTVSKSIVLRPLF